MNFECQVEQLLSLLQRVAGAVERKQSLPILSHVFLAAEGGRLNAIASDLELELTAFAEATTQASGKTTVPARKFLDIARVLNKGEVVKFSCEDDKKAKIRCGSSKFNLAALPANEFPVMESQLEELEFNIDAAKLVSLAQSTFFSVAQNDVRYFLNGLLLKVDANQITFVGTDGHRLACAKGSVDSELQERSVILPRKATIEIVRLFGDLDETVTVGLSKNYIRIKSSAFNLCSRLIEGKYPDYKRVIPIRGDNYFSIDKDLLKESLSRVSVLTDDKYRGVRLQLRNGGLNLIVLNPEQETAEEHIEIEYSGSEFDIGFNSSYLLDVLNHIPAGEVQFYLKDSTSSALIISERLPEAEFVVMPMRL